MSGDWKSADDIENEMRKGDATNLPQLVLDLWRRVDELQEELAQLRRQSEVASN